MFRFVLFLIFPLIVYANNPKVYAALGDVLYDDVNKIEVLRDVDEYMPYIDTINKYVKNIEKIKKDGFAIESGDNSVDKKSYLNKLREYSKTYDFFKRSVKNNFKTAIKNENSQLFSIMINSGLLDTNRYKDEILEYYVKHQQEIDPSGVIQQYLDEDAKLKAQIQERRKKYITKKELEKDKIKRIKELDKLEHQQLEEKLQKELEEQKRKIREEQKEELKKTI